MPSSYHKPKFHVTTASLRNAAVFFFVFSAIWPFLGDFRHFDDRAGTTYHTTGKNVLNRRFQKINSFVHFFEK